MGISPASQHRVTVETALHAAREAEQTHLSGLGRNLYELQLTKLHQDLKRLKSVKSLTRRIAIKRELVPDYHDYLEAVLKAEHSQQDTILTRVMLWCLDIDDFAQGLKLAEFALANNMVMGGDFERDLPDVVAEEMARKVMNHPEPATLAEPMATTYQLVRHADLVDEVAAKLHKAMGLCLETAHPETALKHFEQARIFNPKISVKRHISRLRKLLETTP